MNYFDYLKDRRDFTQKSINSDCLFSVACNLYAIAELVYQTLLDTYGFYVPMSYSLNDLDKLCSMVISDYDSPVKPALISKPELGDEITKVNIAMRVDKLNMLLKHFNVLRSRRRLETIEMLEYMEI